MTTAATPASAPAIPEGIRRLVARLSGEPSVRRVILFGSRARGEAQPRSDVDLAVEAPGVSAREWLRLADMAEDADTLLSIDLVRLDEAPSELRERILAEGRALYER
jgi:predicted nucleotidyltransferase